MADPFLLLDEMGPVDYKPGEAVGAPDHPHRGFETVTYILEGEIEHEDSAGHRGELKPGDVQWMTAGGGIIHSEMPSQRIREAGGRMHGFQIWINLPARLKMTRPRYQELPSSQLPTARSEDGQAHVRVIAGQALGTQAAISTHTPIVLQDWTLAPGADVTTPIAADHQVLVYVFSGKARVGDAGKLIGDGQLAILGAGDVVRLRGSGEPGVSARMLLLAGVPIAEPVVQYGPFVMNSKREITQAIQDFQSGRMGEITRTAEVREAKPRSSP
jgi:redox-sensitive bicupin YhaK (pirin superfamily)